MNIWEHWSKMKTQLNIYRTVVERIHYHDLVINLKKKVLQKI